jgi:hypothetical protein
MNSDQKIKAIRKILQQEGNSAVEEALLDLVSFRPMSGQYPLKTVSETVFGSASGYYNDWKEREDTEILLDEECPFFTEAFLYALFGKDSARDLLGRIRRLFEALGYTREDLDEMELTAVNEALAEKRELVQSRKRMQEYHKKRTERTRNAT